MLTSNAGVSELARIRQELETESGSDYPHTVLRELLVLYDACGALGLDMRRIEQVLGTVGLQNVKSHLEVRFKPRPAAYSVVSTRYSTID